MIADLKKKNDTLYKRKKNLFKKALELSKLCGVAISVVCTDFKNNVSTICTDSRLRFQMEQILEQETKLDKIWHFEYIEDKSARMEGATSSGAPIKLKPIKNLLSVKDLQISCQSQHKRLITKSAKEKFHDLSTSKASPPINNQRLRMNQGQPSLELRCSTNDDTKSPLPVTPLEIPEIHEPQPVEQDLSKTHKKRNFEVSQIMSSMLKKRAKKFDFREKEKFKKKRKLPKNIMGSVISLELTVRSTTKDASNRIETYEGFENYFCQNLFKIVKEHRDHPERFKKLEESSSHYLRCIKKFFIIFHQMVKVIDPGYLDWILMRTLIAYYLGETRSRKVKNLKKLPFDQFIKSVKMFQNTPKNGNKVIEVYLGVYSGFIDPTQPNFDFEEEVFKVKKDYRFNAFKTLYFKKMYLARTLMTERHQNMKKNIKLDPVAQKRFHHKYPYTLVMIIDLGVNLTLDNIHNEMVYCDYVEAMIMSMPRQDGSFVISSMSVCPTEVYIYKIFNQNAKRFEVIKTFMTRFEEQVSNSAAGVSGGGDESTEEFFLRGNEPQAISGRFSFEDIFSQVSKY